ncbi:DUF1566 domain-containing protein [Pseudoalteromonas ruthenica]|uniref:Lcl C-terminal domain-containing protein n=1 Tax=Pseudoalteromonas ruthenica TaxID=151081 RepID=UPI00110B4445|nr:DUF1566 domain-containing protein [Pseudoalteromonas ruthenica]TMO48205.1 hypothetical protein CWC24_04480 [Pseudoalteromonas ruthenica]TMO52007.1 hypothetical protein CWC23_03565 [Pseudoalteromonas ruthenica]
MGRLIHSAISVILATGLLACGGSGGDEVTENASINVGADRDAVEKSELIINAQVSPPGGTFRWQQLSGPAIEGLPSEEQELALMLPDVKGDRAAQIKVDYRAPDNTLVSDTLTINIASANQLPQIAIAQIAPEQLPSQYNDVVTLSAAGSSDPDENGFIASYLWQQTEGPQLQFSAVDEATLSFRHPLLDSDTTLAWTVFVSDDEGGQVSTEYSLLLNKTAQVVIANAGDDQQATEFDTVTLNAGNSETVSGQFSCYWQQQSGSAVTLASERQCETQFVAPDIDVAQQLSFSVRVSDELNRSASDEVTVSVQRRALGLINDTGMSACFNNSQAISCDSTDFQGQDAQQGRDSVAQRLDKVGKGDMAFDFTKLNEFADELPDSATEFACVRDNVTGLIWEVKQANTHTLPNTDLREGQNHYSWALNGEGGVLIGSERAPANSSCPSDVDCSVQQYIDEVNAIDFCGGANWRLPTYVELLSLVDYQRHGQAHMISPDYFIHTPSVSLLGHLNYWTSRTSVDGQSLSQAFIIDMSSGNDLAYPKGNTAYVRLVRNP